MLRLGLVGCGAIARRHADQLSTGSVTGAALAAVCDLDPPKAQAFAARYGVPALADIDAMMNSSAVAEHPRPASRKWYTEIVGLDFPFRIKRINGIPKLFT